MEETKIVELIVRKSRQMYPKGQQFNIEGEYAIISFYVIDEIEGKVHKDKVWDTIMVKGVMPEIKAGEDYHLIAVETYDERYKNYSYDVSYIGERISVMEDIEDIRMVLEESTSVSLASRIIELPNVKEILDNRDVEALKQVKGIGDKLCVKIMDNYHEKLKSGIYLIKLTRLGLNSTMIESLVEKYSNYEVIYNKIKENPYMLADDVKGIGFMKADALAEMFGIAQNSTFRIEAYVSHILKEEANTGKSFVFTKDVLNTIRSNTKKEYPIEKEVLTETFERMKKHNKLWWNDNKSVLASPYVRDTELEIANHLIRIMGAKITPDLSTMDETIRAIEKRKGFEYTSEQREGIETVLKNPLVVVTGLAGCVDCDTEFFNGVEWKKISEYEEGDMVLQYNLDGTANLTKPKSFVKKECEEMTLITNKSGRINQCLSDEHNVVYLTSKNNIAKKPFYKVKKQHLESEAGFNGRFITTFNYNGNGINMSDEDIRVSVMAIADGSFVKNTSRCYLNIQKQRKINRAKDLLDKANISYEITKKGNGFTLIKFNSPIRAREFDDFWYNCTNKQLEVVCDEVLNWDGSLSNDRMRFTTTSKKTADFIQFAFSSIGKRTTISVKNRVGEKYKSGYTRKSIEYDVHISKGSTLLRIRGDKRRNFEDKAKMESYKTKDGYKYCFEVESSMLVLRRNNRIFITGNTGKTTVLEPMTSIFVDQQGQNLIQCALAGKASQRIKEVTGYLAETIHSTLDYNPKNKTKENPTPFGYNEDNPLRADIIICDEFSMVDASLTLALLKAIPTGTRLYLVGDYGQLQCIGFGDILLDLINSGIIPVVKLTQIHRQAQASAIITESIKIRNQQHIIEADEEGYKILGELQDLEIDVTKDRDLLQKRVIKYFKEGLEREHDNIMEVQVVCATRVRGDLSTFEINNIIKDLVNPLKEDEMFAECVVDKGHKYKITKGDKVIITKNNRKALVWSEEVQDYVQGMVCNGNMGMVKEVTTNNMVVDIEGVGTVLVEKKKFNDIELAYAVTCHKCVVGDTLILTDKGLKTIKEVVENKNSVVYNGEKLEKPSDYIKIGREETFKVVTTRGYNITGTDDHKVDFIDRDGNIGVKTIGELESGDALILRLNSDIYGDNISFPDSCYDTYNIRHNTIKYKDYPKILNNELSELLGMIVADGTIDRKRLKFSKKYLEVSERFSYLIKKYFGYEVSPKLRPSGDYMCEVNSTYISNFFMGIDGLKSHKKDIPNIIMETNKENQYAFLRGLFEDGTVNIKKGKFDHIELAMGTGTKTMLKKVQQMLLNMGIVCTLREYKINDKEKNVIYIYKDFANVFFDNIGFISAFKQERLKKCLIKEKRNSDRKSIPFINNLMREVVTDNTDIKLLDKSLKNIIFSSSEKATKNITLTMLKRFLNIYGNIEDERVEYLKRFLKDFYVDTVEKIETNGLEEVYCVTMPKTHKFTQNGFMAWNCQGSQANYVVVAVDSSAWMMLCCEWLYTAITRAKKHCALVGETKAIRRCCYNLMGNHKSTFLPSFFDEFKEKIKKLKEVLTNNK